MYVKDHKTLNAAFRGRRLDRQALRSREIRDLGLYDLNCEEDGALVRIEYTVYRPSNTDLSVDITLDGGGRVKRISGIHGAVLREEGETHSRTAAVKTDSRDYRLLGRALEHAMVDEDDLHQV